MDQHTIEKLKANPHYKLSGKQRQELPPEREHMVEFGQPEFHDQSMQKHPTGPVRLQRRTKK